MKLGRPKKDGTKTVFVRIPKNLNKKLRTDIARNGLELSAMIRLILLKYYEEKDGAKNPNS